MSRGVSTCTHIYMGTHIFPLGGIAKSLIALAQGLGQKCKVKPWKHYLAFLVLHHLLLHSYLPPLPPIPPPTPGPCHTTTFSFDVIKPVRTWSLIIRVCPSRLCLPRHLGSCYVSLPCPFTCPSIHPLIHSWWRWMRAGEGCKEVKLTTRRWTDVVGDRQGVEQEGCVG